MTAMTTSTLPVTYRDWSLGYGKPKPAPAYDEAEARRRFEARETLTVLVGDPDRPHQVMTVKLGGEVVAVHWLDPHNRPVLEHVFAHLDGVEDLFLERTALKTYNQTEPSPTDQATHNEVWYYRPAGTFTAVRKSVGLDDQENSSGTIDEVTLAGLFEPVPRFGAWESLLRADR